MKNILIKNIAIVFVSLFILGIGSSVYANCQISDYRDTLSAQEKIALERDEKLSR